MATQTDQRPEQTDGSATALTVFAPFGILQEGAEDIAEVLQENLAGEALDVHELPQIRVPAGGGTFWTVPSAGKPIGTDTLECVIVLSQRQRAYWSGAEAQRGVPPDCTSHDAVTGHGDNGQGDGTHACDTCPLAEWGSKEGTRGIACRETRVLYLLFPHMSLPMALRVPPTSLKAAKEYLINISAAGLRYHQVLTKITLEKASNPMGQAYSKLAFEQGETMPPEIHGRMLSLARFYQPQLKRAPEPVAAQALPYDVEGIEV